jgi:ABC-type transporter Mla maintaining outer membrane lipid asymmetry permease subunit MlaE
VVGGPQIRSMAQPIAVILSFVASQFATVVLFGQSGGLYDHYFNTFLNPIDLLWCSCRWC